MTHSYPWYIRDWWLSDTRAMLTLEQRGLFRELLDLMVDLGGKLPANERYLQSKCSVTGKEWNRSWPVVRERLHQEPDGFTHRKVSEVVEKIEMYREERRRSGQIGGKKSANSRKLTSSSASNIASSYGQAIRPSSTVLHQPQPPPHCAVVGAVSVNDPPFDTVGGEGAVEDGEGAVEEWSLLPEVVAAPDPRDAWFGEFWAVYGKIRNADKQAARRAFNRAISNQTAFDRIMDRLRLQAPGYLAREPGKRPHASTWLNGARWDDDPDQPAGVSNGSLFANSKTVRAMEIYMARKEAEEAYEADAD